MIDNADRQMTSAAGDNLDEIEAEVLEYFEGAETRAHTQEVAEAVGTTRHTASKYLSVLEAKGLLDHDEIGNAKVWYPVRDEFTVRTLRPDDIDRILAITHQINVPSTEVTEQHDRNLQEELRGKLEDGNASYCIGAEADGTLVGFMIGEERAWEFGHSEKTGWIRILGVAPNYQGRNIGRLLGEELLARFEDSGVKRVQTIIAWDDSNLLPFFNSMGFDMKECTVLERRFDQS